MTRRTVARVVLSRLLALAPDQVAADAGVPGGVELRGVGAGRGEALPHDLFRPVHGRGRLQRHVRRGQADLEDGAAAVLAEQALAEERLAVGHDAADLEGRLAVLQLVQVGRHGVHEAEVGVGQGAVGAFDGEEDAAGEDILGEGFLEELVAADAGAAGGEEADVVVLGAAPGVRGDEGDADRQEEPERRRSTRGASRRIGRGT